MTLFLHKTKLSLFQEKLHLISAMEEQHIHICIFLLQFKVTLKLYFIETDLQVLCISKTLKKLYIEYISFSQEIDNRNLV